LSISAANISSQNVEFSITLNGRVWRWTTVMDVSGAVPTFMIKNITTPYGILRDSTPLPGAVVEGMSESIQSLVANYRSSILVGPPGALVFVVDEGRGYSLPLTGRVTNTGVYGSLLSTTLVASAVYIRTNPAIIPHLASNQSGVFDVSVDSTDLLTTSSPYSGSISLQDGAATNSPQVLPITITVRPKAVVSISPGLVTYVVSRPISGPFPAIATQQFTVQNSGPSGSVLDYQIARLTGLSQSWLASFTPVTGTLPASTVQSITVLVEPVEGLMPGIYEETLRISGYSFNDYADVIIRLVVT